MFRPTETDAHQDFTPKPFRFRAPMFVDGKWVIRPENVRQRRKAVATPAEPVAEPVPEIDPIDALLAEHTLFDRLLKRSRKRR